MKDETMGQEDAAQDAEACAEALESLDRISLDEIAFDDSGVDVQDEPETEAQSDDQDAGDVEPAEDEADHEDTESEAGNQPESDTGEETVLLDSLPAEDSLTRELPGLGSAPAVDETIAMGDIPLPSVPSAREAEVRPSQDVAQAPQPDGLPALWPSRSSPRRRLCCLERISARAGCHCRRQCPHDDVSADWRAGRGPRLFHWLKDPRQGEWPELRRLFCERNTLR